MKLSSTFLERAVQLVNPAYVLRLICGIYLFGILVISHFLVSMAGASVLKCHYGILPVQYTAMFTAVRN